MPHIRFSNVFLGLGAVLCACSADIQVFESTPSKQCESGIFDEDGEAIITSDSCVDSCLTSVASAVEVMENFSRKLSLECEFFVTDFGKTPSWTPEDQPLARATKACEQAIELAESLTENISCSVTASDTCVFSAECTTPFEEHKGEMLLLGARLQGVRRACCERGPKPSRGLLDDCNCLDDPARNICTDIARKQLAEVTGVLGSLSSTCARFDSLESAE